MDSKFDTKAEDAASQAQNYGAFSALNLLHVRTQVADALTQFGKFGILEEYTKHDIGHIDTMLKMYEWLVPESTMELMTAADWLLITLSTYLHDFGLLVTRDEFENRANTEGYVEFASKVRDQDNPEFMDYRAQLQAMPGADAERFLYQEFVRANHALRIRSWLKDVPDPALGFDARIVGELRNIFGDIDETFLDDLGLVCESHHADDLDDVARYRIDKPYGQDPQEEANVQYAAFLLRTADLLDITRSRTPSMSALVINPRNPKSQLEWAKQSAVRSVRPQRIAAEEGEPAPQSDVIEVHASFKESEGYFGLTQYLKYAGEQVATTHRWALASEANGATGYKFPWRKIDISNIVAKGFVAEPFEFTIDQGKILDLLTGHTLYNDSGVVVRELLQNSLDAVRLQAFIEPDAAYEQSVQVAWNSTDRVLTVADNGTGMTQAVIEKNFLRVGSSRYQDSGFRKQHPDFTSISRFGIGVLSAFMVADDVEVITVNQEEPQGRQLTLRDVHGQYLVRLLEKSSQEIPELLRKHGTSVRLKLRPSSSALDVEAVLKYWCLRPGCSVTLSVDGGDPENVGFESMALALESSLTTAGLVRTIDSRLTNNFGDQVEMREVSIDGCEVAFAVVWSQWLQEWRFLRIDQERPGGRAKVILGTAIGGVRVTEASPGFTLASGVAAMADATGKTAPRTNVARSSIERTEEYDQYLDRVYSSYADHIDKEMANLEGTRNYSATRAANEGGYLVEDIAIEQALESEARFRASVLDLPFVVVEQGDSRERRSLTDIGSLDSVWTVEGTTVANFERVLGTVRGATSVSLASLTKALGVAESVQLPDGPLVCGLPLAWAYSGRLFAEEWDAVRFETDGEARILRALWKKHGGVSGWSVVRIPKDLPVMLKDRFDFSERLRAGRLTDVCVPVGIEATAEGIEESIIRCQGRHYILPGSPLLDVKSANPNVPDEHRLWAIAFLLTNALTDVDSRNSVSMRVFGRIGRDSATRTSFLSAVRDYGIYEILDEASTVTAFLSPSAQVLDVDQWDRRSGGQE
ncbi:ATP-binding protein [Herbiconiux sp. 11R-BC]|uniref:HD domain-containing protein n=1 Tax=Herbiconiux sp. 11R-BC TaxID=3111637 RepID=UPI003BFCCF3D